MTSRRRQDDRLEEIVPTLEHRACEFWEYSRENQAVTATATGIRADRGFPDVLDLTPILGVSPEWGVVWMAYPEIVRHFGKPWTELPADLRQLLSNLFPAIGRDKIRPPGPSPHPSWIFNDADPKSLAAFVRTIPRLKLAALDGSDPSGPSQPVDLRQPERLDKDKVHRCPTWRDVLPPPPRGTPLSCGDIRAVRIEWGASDEKLVEAFQSWLKQVRPKQPFRVVAPGRKRNESYANLRRLRIMRELHADPKTADGDRNKEAKRALKRYRKLFPRTQALPASWPAHLRE